MFPKEENMAGIIMEFKAKEKGMNFEKAAKFAMKQIEKTGYDTEMTQRGITNIFKLGIGFFRKRHQNTLEKRGKVAQSAP